MYSVKINGISYDNVPSSIDDVTIGRFIKFRDVIKTNPLELIYWAIDCKPAFTHTDTVEKELAGLLSLIDPVSKAIFAFIKANDTIDPPETIEVLGCEVKIKKGLLNDLPYWPYVVTKNIIIQEAKKEPFDPTDRIPEVLAHYLYSIVTKSEYSEAKANEFVEVVNDIAMVPAIKLGNFFLWKHRDLFPLNKQSLSQRLKMITKKPE